MSLRPLIPLLFLAVTGVATGAAPIALAIHGGAGTIERAALGKDKEKAIRDDLRTALERGYQVLKDGGSSIDAVSTAIVVLEDSPHFNAGRGAVFNADGINELDAAIMDGPGHRAGAIAGVQRVRNPIQLARAVMEHSPHVMMVGAGAERFATEQGVTLVDPSWFYTEERWQQLEKAREQEKAGGGGTAPNLRYFGTVGAVALDNQGRLAAGTSTGGMTNKRFGRVGDSPLIGAGTYADAGCAVSATGHGEFFIREVVAHDICARARYAGLTVGQAARTVIDKELPARGGTGGVIALDAKGRISQPFNTPGMYRAAIDAKGKVTIAIYADEK
jgi:L-asparaginase / beta-aspartyl-peptidase